MFNRDYAWWLPKGSVRALLAIAVVVPTMVVLASAQEYGMMVGLAVIIVNFYFLKDVLTGRTQSDDVDVSNPIDPVPEYTPVYSPPAETTNSTAVNGEPTG